MLTWRGLSNVVLQGLTIAPMEKTDHTEVRAFFRTKGAVIYIVLVVILVVLNFATPFIQR